MMQLGRLTLAIKIIAFLGFLFFVNKLITINNELMINDRIAILQKLEAANAQRERVAQEMELMQSSDTTLPLTTSTIHPAIQRLLNRQSLLKCLNQPLERDTRLYGNYWMVRNFMRGSVSINMGCAESITYTTHGDYTFIKNLPELVARWQAPISFAIFAPGDDVYETISSIQYARNCLEESDLIRQFVTFHIYFPFNHMPESIPLSESDVDEWPFECSVPIPPYENVTIKNMYKTRFNLTYPINVGRNIARQAANTYFIFACDVELYPTNGLVDSFLDLVDRNSSAVLGGSKPRVFPMPVFEIEEDAPIPDTKSELLSMLENKTAIPFHAHVCKSCHLVPNQTLWLKENDTDHMSIISVGKRYGKFKYWEPFYISDNTEPLFDERVTWEGQSNKRIQNYAMCLLDYEYHVLHPSFLIHSPGVKQYDKATLHKRMQYVRPMNNFIRNKIVPEYLVLYGNDSKCVV